jgi:hypothetical protein
MAGSGPWFRRSGWAYALLIVLALHLSWGLRIPRVVHADERWTLAAIQESPARLIANVLLNDNHPPFYYLIHHAWSGLAGVSIPSGRLLSFAFALFTLAIFFAFHRYGRAVPLITPLLLISTNPLFTYYAATIRPYSLIVALASSATLSALVLRQGGEKDPDPRPMLAPRLIFFASCLALGSTHYYGTLLVFVLLGIDLLEGKIDRSRLITLICLGLLLIWPGLQLLSSTAQQQLASNSWVRVMPGVSTFNNFLLGTFPSLILARDPRLLFSLVLLTCLLATRLPWPLQRPCWPLARPARQRLAAFVDSRPGYLLLVIGLVFAVSALIDCLTPFTTPYYFLVCLPAVALLFDRLGRDLQHRLGPWSAALLIAGTVASQLVLAGQRLSQA